VLLPTETAVQQLPSAGSGPSGPLNKTKKTHLMEGEGEAKAWDRLTSETSPLGVCVGQSLSALHGPFSDAPDRGNTSREACALLTAEECARGCVRVCVRTRT
jgi:hypothetical protein